MTKTELIDAVARRKRLGRPTAERIVAVLFDGIRDALAAGDRVEIRGFGTFHVKRYKGYTGRNPRTGTAIVVEPKSLPVFRVGKELRERVNGEGEEG